MGCTTAGPDCTRDVGRGRTQAPYHLGDEGSPWKPWLPPGIGSWESLLSWRMTILQKVRHCFLSYVWSGTGDPHLGRAVHNLSHCSVHPEEEREHSRRPTQLPRPGAFDWVVLSSSSIRCPLQELRMSSHWSLRHKSKCKAALVCVSHFQSQALKENTFWYSWDDPNVGDIFEMPPTGIWIPSPSASWWLLSRSCSMLVLMVPV